MKHGSRWKGGRYIQLGYVQVWVKGRYYREHRVVVESH